MRVVEKPLEVKVFIDRGQDCEAEEIKGNPKWLRHLKPGETGMKSNEICEVLEARLCWTIGNVRNVCPFPGRFENPSAQ